jgi:hypothetical protein
MTQTTMGTKKQTIRQKLQSISDYFDLGRIDADRLQLVRWLLARDIATEHHTWRSRRDQLPVRGQKAVCLPGLAGCRNRGICSGLRNDYAGVLFRGRSARLTILGYVQSRSLQSPLRKLYAGSPVHFRRKGRHSGCSQIRGTDATNLVDAALGYLSSRSRDHRNQDTVLDVWP